MKPTSTFSANDVPLLLWPDLVEHFGVDYEYHTADGEVIPDLRGIYFEGAEDEPIAPGRYARLWVDLRDLPREPRSSDWVLIGDSDTYDVEVVKATPYDIGLLVIKRSGQAWQALRR